MCLFFPSLCTATWGVRPCCTKTGPCRGMWQRSQGCPHGSSCQQSHGEGTWPVGDVFGAVPLPPADSGPVLLALLLRAAPRCCGRRCARGRDAAEMRPPGWRQGEERKKQGEKCPHGLARSTKPQAVFAKRGFGAVNEQRSSRGVWSGRDPAAHRSCWVLGGAQLAGLCSQPRGPAGPILPGAG